MDIKEIAQALKLKMQDPDDGRFDIGEFAEALIAEIAKGNEPAVWWNKDTCQLFIGEIDDVERKDLFEPLYAFPPSTEPQWKSIESAPKDGTAVLVMRDIWPGTKSGRAEECNGHNTYVAAWWDGDNAWICYMDAVCDHECPIEPTHWMPLPEAPKGEQG